MSHIKKVIAVLDLAGKSVSQLILFAQTVVEKMGLSAYFTAPGVVIDPPLSEITTLTEEVEEKALAAETDGEQETAELHTAVSHLNNKLTQLGHFVEDFANDDPENAEAIVLSAGMKVKKDSAPIGPLGEPQNVVIDPQKNGDLNINCDPLKGANAYLFRARKTSDAPDAWFMKDDFESVSTASKYTWEDLEAGEEYEIQVAGIGAMGRGPWSDGATSRVL